MAVSCIGSASNISPLSRSPSYICDAVRTPFGRYGGALSSVRTDDLAAVPIKALLERTLAPRPVPVAFGRCPQ